MNVQFIGLETKKKVKKKTTTKNCFRKVTRFGMSFLPLEPLARCHSLHTDMRYISIRLNSVQFDCGAYSLRTGLGVRRLLFWTDSMCVLFMFAYSSFSFISEMEFNVQFKIALRFICLSLSLAFYIPYALNGTFSLCISLFCSLEKTYKYTNTMDIYAFWIVRMCAITINWCNSAALP